MQRVRAAYQAQGLRAVVRPFLTEMELALDAATVAVSRAGASSMAELAAMRLPSILMPYPHASDNHQFYNALAYVETGAARMLVQNQATPELLAKMVVELAHDQARQEDMRRALAGWHKPEVAANIAQLILNRMERKRLGVKDPSPRSTEPVAPGSAAPGSKPDERGSQAPRADRPMGWVNPTPAVKP